MTWTVTIDNGSTFTDGCLFADGRVWSVKVLTTPYDLMRCFVEVFRHLARIAGLENETALLRRVEEVRYSTTSGTNALLVREGVRVGLITNQEGAADGYGLRTIAPDLFAALVGDRIVGLGVSQTAGEALDPFIVNTLRELLNKGAQWIVVSFPEPWGEMGEREFKRRYMKLFPGHLLGSMPVLFSRELCVDPEDGRRTATALLNGFLQREMARFLYHADGWVREHHVPQPLRIMRNDGGCGRVAKTSAVKTLDSGPMGGLSGAAALARQHSLKRLVTVDVGGTSTDIGLVEDQRPVVNLFGSVHNLPLSFSFPALHTAALGGGSLFQVKNGAITIGPESAGALPGPVCFGRGGNQPTLTDAALVAGYLDAARFAGGSIEIRSDLAEQAIEEQVARPLGLKNAQAGARAMIEAFAEAVATEVRDVLTRRSWPLQGTVLVLYGGSGPLLACMVAERAGLRNLMIPPASASFSALGVGFVNLAHEYRTLLRGAVDNERWQKTADTLRTRGERDMFGEGIARSECTGFLRVRKEKDGSEVAIGGSFPMPEGLNNGHEGMVLDYCYTARSGGEAQFPTPERSEATVSGASERTVLLSNTMTKVSVIQAEQLTPGMSGQGSCILEASYWSAVVLPGWRWEETGHGLRISR